MLDFNLNLGEDPAAQAQPRPEVENVVIIGSGPAGWSAAIYTARADLRPLLITGNELGGQIALTTEVENFPGFDEAIQGPELVERMQRQAERFGTEVLIDSVTELDVTGPTFTVKTASGSEFRARSVIVATGASPRRMGVPNEETLTGRGVSYCATCDGFFFRGKDVVVAGGGDSALQEALFLTKFASRVRIIHRRDSLRAGATLQHRAGESQNRIHLEQRRDERQRRGQGREYHRAGCQNRREPGPADRWRVRVHRPPAQQPALLRTNWRWTTRATSSPTN